MSETKGEWAAYRDTITTDGCSIDVRHTGHEKTYTEVATVYRNEDARLIVTAITALKAINPDNPLAVARAIKPMYEALKVALADLHTAFDGEKCDHPVGICFCGVKATIEQASNALAQAERKAE